MGKSLNRLMKISSKGIGGSITRDTIEIDLPVSTPLSEELMRVLQKRNGFYAFESALHFFSSSFLKEWNEEGNWKSLYDLPKGLICFAEDVFGEQFCFLENSVYRFNPETAELNKFADSIEAWSEVILTDYEVETGHIVAHDWQVRHGKLEVGHRLVPIRPFVLGGEYTVDNLHSMNGLDGMRLRAQIARQIRGLPDGKRVRLVIN